MEKTPSPPRHSASPAQPLARQERRQIAVPYGPPARVTAEMHARVPAAGHGQHIRLNRLDPVAPPKADTLQRFATAAAANLRVRVKWHIQFTDRIRARVDQRRHVNARRLQVAHRPVPRIAVGKNRHPASRTDPPAVDISPQRPGHHHPGPVIVGEGHGPFDRPRRQHRAFCRDPPETPLQGAPGASRSSAPYVPWS